MPHYDYRCEDCQQRVTLFYKTYAEFDKATPTCSHCQGDRLVRLIGRVALAKSDDARMDGLADESALSQIDENDPRSIGRFMRKMGGEMGEDLGEEFNEVVDRLEQGQSPDDIEKAMPSLKDEGPGAGD